MRMQYVYTSACSMCIYVHLQYVCIIFASCGSGRCACWSWQASATFVVAAAEACQPETAHVVLICFSQSNGMPSANLLVWVLRQCLDCNCFPDGCHSLDQRLMLCTAGSWTQAHYMEFLVVFCECISVLFFHGVSPGVARDPHNRGSRLKCK